MQNEIIKVTGMTCGGCSASVTKALQSICGVKDVSVSLSDAEARVQYDEKLTSTARLHSAVEEAGYGVGLPNTA